MTEVQNAEEQKAEEIKPEAGTPTEETKEESSQDIDYKAELDRERERRIKAEAIIQRNKEKPKENDDFDAPEYNQEQINELVAKQVKEQVEVLERRVTAGQIDSLVKQVSSSPDEAALIKYHLDNTVRPSGDVQADVDYAKLLANSKKFSSQMNEMKRAIVAKNSVSTGGGAGAKKPTTQPNQLTEAEKNFRRGLGLSDTPAK